MKVYFRSSIIMLMLFGMVSACGGGGGGGTAPPTGPSIPASLTATGSLHNIHLSWTASTGGNLTGYNLYKSTDGSTFTNINSALVTTTSYDDTIASPAGDGVLYYYQVTAMGDVESAASNTVSTVHGTRLAASYAAGFTTVVADSPYVAEGTVVVDGGGVTVATGTKLYMMDNSSLDILKHNPLIVNGLFRILASTSSPATLTAHAAGGALGLDEGFRMEIANCVDYASSGDSGTLLQNAQIRNLESGNNGFDSTIKISGCKPKLDNLKISSNSNTQASYLRLTPTSGATLQRCSLSGINPIIEGDQRTTGFQMDHNTITPGDYNYVLDFTFASAGPINSGQVANNVFDSSNQLDIGAVTTGGIIPLGNNYWKQGVPSIRYQSGSTSTPDFTPVLTSPPAGVGPTW